MATSLFTNVKNVGQNVCGNAVQPYLAPSVLIFRLKCNYSLLLDNCDFMFSFFEMHARGDDVNVTNTATGLPFIAPGGSCMQQNFKEQRRPTGISLWLSHHLQWSW